MMVILRGEYGIDRSSDNSQLFLIYPVSD